MRLFHQKGISMHITNEMIHPELRKKGKLLRGILPYFSIRTFHLCNRLQKLMKGKHTKELSCEEIWIDRPHPVAGEKKLRICVYRSKDSYAHSGSFTDCSGISSDTTAKKITSPGQKVSSLQKEVPGLLWIHGGGYAIGAPEQDENFIKNFINECDCVVVAPDYCLSTTAPYPAALEDCYTALLWLKAHATDYHIRNDQIMVGGDSAGGGLTAALTIYARDKKEVSISFQMPLYPMLDDRMLTESSQKNDAPVWNTKSNEYGWKLYLGELYGADQVPAYAAPARLADYHGLPPAFTFVGSIEPFRDETIAYMEALKSAGIPVEYRIFEGCFHAFDLMGSGTDIAKEATGLLLQNFRYATEHYFAPQPGTDPASR